MKYLILVLIMGAFQLTAKAQANGSSDTSFVVHKDPRIDKLVLRQANTNKKAVLLTSNGQMKGWRIQVLNTNNRDLANKTRADLLTRFPGHKTYMGYQSPFFKIRIGNFRDKNAAEDLKKQLRTMFPTGVYVIPDIIEYKMTKEDLMEEDDEKSNKK
jgi:cell division septation protein DedD